MTALLKIDRMDLKLAQEICAKSGEIGAYRTASHTLRLLLKKVGEPSPDQLTTIADEFAQKANDLNAEVMSGIAKLEAT
jgi:hypothetical protein